MRLVRRPDGVVCVNSPRNAPANSGMLTAWVLAAGNAAVIRVPRSVPVSLSYLSGEILAPALDTCQAPPGTLNVVSGDQPAIMRQWLASPLVSSIFYFGTSASGEAVERRCVAAGKKPVLELSGNDGVLVWRDAPLEAVVEALSENFLGSGQICMAPNYVLAHPAIADRLLERLARMPGQQRAGHPTTAGVTFSPVLRPDQFRQQLDEALARGARLVCGGRRIGATTPRPSAAVRGGDGGTDRRAGGRGRPPGGTRGDVPPAAAGRAVGDRGRLGRPGRLGRLGRVAGRRPDPDLALTGLTSLRRDPGRPGRWGWRRR